VDSCEKGGIGVNFLFSHNGEVLSAWPSVAAQTVDCFQKFTPPAISGRTKTTPR
jgi:hypothetical protein